MKTSKVTIIAIAVVLTMVFCSFVPVVNSVAVDGAQVSEAQDEKQTFKYVSLGDSMTAGYGLFGYYPDGDKPNQLGFLKDVETTYPHLLTEYLKAELGEEYDVQHAQLAMSSNRSIELRAMFDDTFIGKSGNLGDEHTTGLFSDSLVNTLCNVIAEQYPELAEEYSGFQLVQQVYRTELADADLITYNSHYDFGYALSGKIMEIASGGPGIDTDFTLYYEPEYVEMAKTLENALLDYLINYLAEQGIDAKAIIELVEKIVRAAVYSVVSYCANFDALMEYIYTNNPDAKVIVIDTYNMFENMDLTISGITISIAGFYQTLLDLSNFYAQYSSPYALYCYHLNLDQPMILGNEFKTLERSELSDDAKAGLVYSMGKADKPAQISGVLFYDGLDLMGNGNLSKFMKIVFSSSNLNGDLLIGQDITKLMAELTAKTTGAVELLASSQTTVTYDPEDGSCTVRLNAVLVDQSYTFSKDELSLLWLYLFSLSGAGILSHPSPLGHSYIESCIEELIVDKEILVEGSRVYISGGEIKSPADVPAVDSSNILYNYVMREVREVANYTYMNWDGIVDFVNSEEFDAAYEQLQALYATWKQYITSGGLDANLEELHQKLIYVDENWDTIFAGYTEEEIIIQLHAALQTVLLDWDSVKEYVGQVALFLDVFFFEVLTYLEPDHIRQILADTLLSNTVHEFFLNVGLNCDVFVKELYEKLSKAESPGQAMVYITALVWKYSAPCHEARMIEAVDATCTTDGCIEHYTCKICGAVYAYDDLGELVVSSEEEVTIPGGHTLVEHAAVEAKCNHEGNNLYYTCEKCTVVLKADKVTPTTVQDETIPMTEHHHEKIPGVTPTKTKAGSTEGDVCKDCGTVFVAPKEIPATGSDNVVVTTTTSSAEFFVSDSDEIKSFSVKFDGTTSGVKSEITIPSSSIDALKGKTVKFGVEKSTKYSDAYVIEMTVDGSSYSGSANIGVPYESSKGVPSVKWIEGGSEMEVVSTDSSTGLVTFKTTHNSTYQVSYSPAPASNDQTMIIVIVAIAIVLAALIAGGIIWKKKKGAA